MSAFAEITNIRIYFFLSIQLSLDFEIGMMVINQKMSALKVIENVHEIVKERHHQHDTYASLRVKEIIM